MSDKTPGGLSATDFKIASLEAGEWLWGMVQGAFNQKASLSQIIVDAVIGMIPVVGDVTAVRDIIAVSIRLVDDPKARDDVWEWVLLVVLIIALIPVIGGVAKGVGRLVIKAAGESGRIANAAAKTAHFAEAAKEIIAFLNRFGHGHAEKWLLKLKFADHQAAVMQHFGSFVKTMTDALTSIEKKLGPVLSGAIRQRIAGLKKGLADLKTLGDKMIPKAVKELDAKLREIQQFVHSGGASTSRATTHAAAAGDKAAVHLADEARLLDQHGAVKTAKGGLAQNIAVVGKDADFAHIYTPKSGFPDLRKHGVDNNHYSRIEAYAGKIINRPLKEGEEIYRVFGPARKTHGVKIDESYAGGPFWGLGTPPPNAERWRIPSGVKDEWNGDGFIVIGKVPKKSDIKACVGLVSEQVGKDLPGQYLKGGGSQAFISFDRNTLGKVGDETMTLSDTGKKVIADKKPRTWIDPHTGMHFQIKPTGWPDANGIWGYAHHPGIATVQTARLGAREMATKDTRDSQGAKK
jgi:hypothetical protein